MHGWMDERMEGWMDGVKEGRKENLSFSEWCVLLYVAGAPIFTEYAVGTMKSQEVAYFQQQLPALSPAETEAQLSEPEKGAET